MGKVLFIPLNQNHVLIFQDIIKSLESNYEVLCHDRISEAEQYHTESILKKKEIPYRHFSTEILRSPGDAFLIKVLKFFEMKKTIRSAFNEIKPNLVVLAIDNDPIAQIAVNESKRRGIKTLLVPEGLIKQDLITRDHYLSDYFYKLLRVLGIYIAYIKYGTGGCDKILVSGKRSLDILKKLGVEREKMVMVGQQKYDSFLEKIRKEKPVSNEVKVYLYAASTRIFEEDGEIRLIGKIAESANKLNLDLIIKLHPRAPQKPEDLLNLIENSGTLRLKIIKEGYETFEILKGVDAVITISSAIILEALMMDKECIAANYLAGRRRFDYDSYDAVYSIESEEEIYDVLKDSMLFKKSYENKKRLLEDELYKLDGKAGVRTAEIIESMIS